MNENTLFTDPLHPTTPGAFLAEEWSINPFSVLLSFLEMMFIEETKLSTNKTLSATFNLVERLLTNLQQQQEQQRRRQQVRDVTSLTQEDRGSTFTRVKLAWTFVCHCLLRAERSCQRMLQLYKLEIKCLLLYCMERSSLHSKSCATLAESLYGAKRVKLETAAMSSTNTHQSVRKLVDLSITDKTRVAILAALVPYLQEKFEIFFGSNEFHTTNLRVGNSWRRGWWQRSRKETLAALYYVTCSALKCSNAWFRWRFLIGHSIYFDNSCYLLGQVVRRIAHSDLQAQPHATLSETDTKRKETLVPTDNSALPSSTQSIVLYAVAAITLFGWLTQLRADWESHRRQRHLERHQSAPVNDASTNSDLDPPPPPPPWPIHLSVAPNLCPLCQKPRRHPTASTSGHVFCFTCILPYVKQHHVCPVTSMSCSEDRLVRLFEPRNDLTDE